MTVEIETILRNGLDRIIQEHGMERLAFRFHDGLADMVKRVDLENYGLFRAIMLEEGREWEVAFSDVSQDDQMVVADIATQFYAVSDKYTPLMTVDVQRLRAHKRRNGCHSARDSLYTHRYPECRCTHSDSRS